MRYLFTCGGTAGHINPALAVADRLKTLDSDAQFLFVGASDRMETDLVPREGYEIKTVDVSSFRRSLSPKAIAYNLGSLKKALSSTREAKKIVKEFRPDIAVGTGGYVCYPVLKAASALSIPTLVHESNAVPGLTTKMLQDEVDRILVGFEESRQNYGDPTKVIVTGKPVRGAFTACTKAEAKAKLNLPSDKPLVVSVWGSLGAQHMNAIMTDFIRLAAPDADFRLIHSAGQNRFEGVAEKLKDVDLETAGMDVRPYIYDMPLVMAAADLVLCRAGASTLAELTLLGKPAILVPSPNVTNNHQEKNARVLEHVGGAKVLLEGEFTAESLLADVRSLLADTSTLAAMAQNMKSAGVADATERITQMVLEMAKEG
ncbi:MAG: undecaprenyldiphospho-muramoylpentapeptide beta-N-acetylglucosaminyltransferase [Oscillospiraceae bacterium]|nr:undecaprenyldiphospho-muramoylpentapeptide beta-N-acetylglucosaminyltransferase [Oscillospiraceae bacterium]